MFSTLDYTVKKINHVYFRTAIFGLQDALVSTTGVVVGVAAGNASKEMMLLAATVTVLVEALSMASGQYASEKSIHSLEGKRHTDNLVLGALLMFAAYIIGGFIPIAPILVVPKEFIIATSLLASLVGLFLLGWWKSTISGENKFRTAFQVMIIGGLSAAVGLLVGLAFQKYV